MGIYRVLEFRQVSEQNRSYRDSSIGKSLESADSKAKILVKVS